MRCYKAQDVSRHEANGTVVKFTKCVNFSSKHFKHKVEPEDCKKCSLKQEGPCKQNCNKKRPRNAKFSEPELHGNLLKYIEEDAPVPEGFEEMEEGYKSLWPACPGMVTNNTINNDGSLKVVVSCSFKNKMVSFEECSNCFNSAKKQVLEEQEEKKNAPSLPTKVRHYTTAVYNWVKQGGESRTDEEVEELLKICEACSRYDSAKKACKVCGCKVKSGGRAISNKLKMKSEHCPLGKW